MNKRNYSFLFLGLLALTLGLSSCKNPEKCAAYSTVENVDSSELLEDSAE